MERKHSCPACNAQANGVKTRVACKHTCGKFPRKIKYSGGVPVKEDTPEPLTEAQKIKAAKLWIGAIVDSAGFPLFGDAISEADARAIANHVKTFMVDFMGGAYVTTDTSTIIRYVKRYIK